MHIYNIYNIHQSYKHNYNEAKIISQKISGMSLSASLITDDHFQTVQYLLMKWMTP